MIFLKSKRLEKKTSDAREPSLYRSICTSIISTLLSLVMLVGTTFAWFTDSVTTGVYTIQAGNLKTAMYFRTELPDESSTSEPMWFPLNEGNMSMFGGMTFTSEASQTAYLKLVNNIEEEKAVDVVYKFSFESVDPETPGTLKNGETAETGKKLSEMLSFSCASVEENDSWMTQLKSAVTTPQKLTDFDTASPGPFEVTVAQGKTVYVALTIAMDEYSGTWETQPTIQLRLEIIVTNAGEGSEENIISQLNELVTPSEPVGVPVVTEIENEETSTTEPPTTEPPTTEPPTTETPTTEPSMAEPSTTETPTTEPSMAEPSTTGTPTTGTPATETPTTEPSMAEPSTTGTPTTGTSTMEMPTEETPET